MSQLGIDLSEILTGILPALPLQEPLPDVADAARLNHFLNALPAAIYMTDADGRITYFNEAVAAVGCRPSSTSICGAARGGSIGPAARRCRTIPAPWRLP
jgi:PAS domain-containing protein